MLKDTNQIKEDLKEQYIYYVNLSFKNQKSFKETNNPSFNLEAIKEMEFAKGIAYAAAIVTDCSYKQFMGDANKEVS